MLRQRFLQEIESSSLMLHPSGFKSVDYICNAILEGKFVPETIEQTIFSTRGEIFDGYPAEDQPSAPSNPFDKWASGSIAIIPLVGLMLKYGYWWTYGVDDIATIIRLAYESASIDAVILKADTPGGSTDSLFLLQEVLSDKKKPTYGFIDGMCCSCGYIAFACMDKIYSINPMAQVGGIGVLARLLVPNEKVADYKVVEVYPDESSQKNIEERELLKGNKEPMKEMLSKIALNFQQFVKTNRPKISDDTLQGKTYFSYEAQPLGLIDGIRSLQQTVDELETLVSKRKKLLSTL